MRSIITLEGIDEALKCLNYGNKKALKYRLIQAIRNCYTDEKSLEGVKAVDTDTLVNLLWDTGSDPAIIKNRRKNLNSIKSSINADLKGLYNQGKNPEGIIIGPDNTFDMSEEAKSEFLESFTFSTRGNNPVPLGKITDVLKVVNDLLTNDGSKTETETMIDRLKELVKSIAEKIGVSGKVGLAGDGAKHDSSQGLGGIGGDSKGAGQSGSDRLFIEEAAPEDEVEEVDDAGLEEAEPEDEVEEIDDGELDEAEPDGEVEEIDDAELEEAAPEDEVEEIDDAELEELEPDDEVEEIDDGELEEVETDGEVEEIDDAELEEAAPEDEIEEIDDDEIEELEPDEEVEEIDDDEVEEAAPEDEVEEVDDDGLEEVTPDDEVEEIDDGELEEVEPDGEVEEIDDDELEEAAPEDEIEEIDDAELEEAEPEDEVEEIEDGELEEVESDGEVEEIDDDELEEAEPEEEIEEVDDAELEEVAPDDEVEEIDDGELEEVEPDEKVEEIDDDGLEEVEHDDEVEKVDDDELEEAAPDEEIEEIDDDELEEAAPDEEVEEVDDAELEEVEPEDEIEEIDDDEITEEGGGSDVYRGNEQPSINMEELLAEYGDRGYEGEKGVQKARLLSEEFNSALSAMDRYYNQYILIPEAKYKLGSMDPDRNERTAKNVRLNAFYFGKFPVINAIFEIFIEKSGYITTAERLGYGTVYYGRYQNSVDNKTGLKTLNWNSSLTNEKVEGACWYQPLGPGSTLHNKRNHPVVQVSLEDAIAFAAWTGKRLPTEDEWEAASRTAKCYKFPWGERFKKDSCNIEDAFIGDTTPVDNYKKNVNSLGVSDTIGNVLEWTIDMAEVLENEKTVGSRDYIVKGGSWSSMANVNLSSRYFYDPRTSSNIIGFRSVAY